MNLVWLVLLFVCLCIDRSKCSRKNDVSNAFIYGQEPMVRGRDTSERERLLLFSRMMCSRKESWYVDPLIRRIVGQSDDEKKYMSCENILSR